MIPCSLSIFLVSAVSILDLRMTVEELRNLENMLRVLAAGEFYPQDLYSNRELRHLSRISVLRISLQHRLWPFRTHDLL